MPTTRRKTRTLLFCFDGTANDPEDVDGFSEDGSISNILKLHVMFGGDLNSDSAKWLQTDEGNSQCSFYYSGVGTYGNRFRKFFNSAFGLPSLDVRRIIKAGLEDFDSEYRSGDRILIFGFSRGAAIARIFAGKIAKKGKKVAFLGVFDTVAAMGKIDFDAETRPTSDVVFEDCTMHSNIQYAVHLVALDEKRLAFQPTLFNHDERRILEVWFPGAHSDVGGGYWYDGLSDITLRFMLDQIVREFPDSPVQIIKTADIKYHRLNKQGDPEEAQITRDDLDIHPVAHGKSHSQHRMKHIAKRTLHHRLLCVNEDDKEAKGKVPLVHRSVQDRFAKVADYRPIALRNRKYRIVDDIGKPVGRKHVGIADLRE